jgi:3,4-dihydroxy 2-butanone 4-phosphate synthase/GTP cyclohydrolase II
VYGAPVEERQLIALVKGDIGGDEAVLTRVHAGSVVADLFCSTPVEGGAHLREAIEHIERAGRGVILYLAPQQSLAFELGRVIRGRTASSERTPTAVPASRRAGAQSTLRQFGLGAQVLADLGVAKLRLLTNSQRKIAGLTGYGLEVVERVPLAVGES